MKKDTETALKWIVNILQKHDMPFQIGGGFAARIYGAERELADIDIAIPTDKLNELLLEVKDYITYDLKHYLDEKWDCIGMTIKYEGQEIDFVGAQGKKIFDGINNKWVTLENDFSNNEYKEIYGLSIPLMPKERLIEYKSILKRDVDLLDLEGLNKNIIKAIAFDYGGVIEITDNGLMQKIADYLQTTLEDWLKVYLSLNYLCNTGKNSYEEVYAFTAKEFNASNFQISQIHKMMKENMDARKINFELIELIKDLKNRNYKIGLLSNNYIKLRQQMIDEDMIKYFDSVIISAEVGFQKPQPEIFEILFNDLGVKSEELIFIDDSKSSLNGADKIGYVPILYKNNESLKQELSNILPIKL